MVKAINRIESSSLANSAKSVQPQGDDFEKTLEGITLSKHALKRLLQRGVPFDDEIAKTLSKGIDQAQEKGGNEALLLLKDSAYIVGVSKRQLITAFKMEDLSSNVVTNIDTAVILNDNAK